MEEIKKSNIVPMVEEYLKDFYKSILEERAVPELYDGLKPVQRRILFDMYTSGLKSSGRYCKSANASGSVLKYHPHSSDSIYETVCNMATTFQNNVPLIDFHGGLKNIYGDRSAAPRYTEIKLTKFAEEVLLDDLNKNIVDYQPNFDNTLTEPKYFPAKIPMFLLNGNLGIAGGFACSILPHSLETISRKVSQLIDNPDIEVEEYLKDFYPTFPTGGKIVNISSIAKAYSKSPSEDGKDNENCKVRGTIARDEKNHFLTITEIPFYKSLEQIEESIKKAIKNEKISGIKNIKNLSTKGNIELRLVVDKKEDLDYIESQIFKYTSMQFTIPISNLATENGKFKMHSSIKEMIQTWIDCRTMTIKRKFNEIVRKKSERIHIIDGLLIALDPKNIDRIIKIIKNGNSDSEIIETLMDTFILSNVQAEYILEMKLRKLNKLQVESLKNEKIQLESEIKDHIKFLASKKSINEYIKNEVEGIAKKYGKKQNHTEYDDSNGFIEIESTIKDQDFCIILTQNNLYKKFPITNISSQKKSGKGRSIGKIREDDIVIDILKVNSRDRVLFFTEDGKLLIRKCYELKESTVDSYGKSISSIFKSERIINILSISESEMNDENNALMFATEGGFIKTTLLSEFLSGRCPATGLIAIKLKDNDKLLSVKKVNITDKESTVINYTENGICNRFLVTDIPMIGRNGMGSAIFNSSTMIKNKLISCEVTTSESVSIIAVTKNGIGKASDINDFPIHSRRTKGFIGIQLAGKDKVISAVVVNKDDNENILVLSNKNLISVPTTELRSQKRRTRGCRLKRLSEGEYIVNACKD